MLYIRSGKRTEDVKEMLYSILNHRKYTNSAKTNTNMKQCFHGDHQLMVKGGKVYKG